MPTSEYAAYIRGEANLRSRDFVDAGLTRDTVANNLNHLYDQACGVIVNTVISAGSIDQIKPPSPIVGGFVFVTSWPYRVGVKANGDSFDVVYKMRAFRSGGSGTVTWFFRIAPRYSRGFDPAGAPASPANATHSTAATSPADLIGRLWMPASGLAAFAREDVGVPVVKARLEAWAKISGASSVPCLSSAYARQFAGA